MVWKQLNLRGGRLLPTLLIIFALTGFISKKTLKVVVEVQPSDKLIVVGIRGKGEIDSLQAKMYVLEKYNKQIDTVVFINCDTAIMLIKTCQLDSTDCLAVKGLDDIDRYMFWLKTLCGAPEVHKTANTIWCGCKYKVTSTRAVSICFFSRGFHPKDIK